MQNVLVLGATGMLGAMVTKVLSDNADLKVIATTRSLAAAPKFTNVEWREVDVEGSTVEALVTLIGEAKWIVNAIGIIKPYIHDDNPVETGRAIRVNSLFPHILAKAAEQADAQVIQIATDCVYSGKQGAYKEFDVHDALDVYGKTKSVGEVPASPMHHLRCSIIGPELRNKVSLLEWFLKQPEGSTVNGYTNHQWNGVTTYHYGKLCHGIIVKNLALPHLQHIIPGDSLSKADLLKTFAEAYKRDVTVNPGPAEVVVDRTLQTADTEKNNEIWSAAGYDTPPTLHQMVTEMANYSLE